MAAKGRPTRALGAPMDPTGIPGDPAGGRGEAETGGRERGGMKHRRSRLGHACSRTAMAVVAALAAATLGLAAAPQAGASHPGVVTLTVTRVVNIGDTGIEDFARGQADLYATAVIDGTAFDSKSLVQDGHDVVEPVNPTWTFSRSYGAGASDSANVELEIWDADDCSGPKCTVPGDIFGGNDDQGDVNPTPGVDNINLVVDRTTGTWTGDTTSNC